MVTKPGKTMVVILLVAVVAVCGWSVGRSLRGQAPWPEWVTGPGPGGRPARPQAATRPAAAGAGHAGNPSAAVAPRGGGNGAATAAGGERAVIGPGGLGLELRAAPRWVTAEGARWGNGPPPPVTFGPRQPRMEQGKMVASPPAQNRDGRLVFGREWG